MRKVPEAVQQFLSGKRFAVAGVSRNPSQPANFILKKLRQTGYAVFPVNPNAAEVEGERCYPSLRSVPVPVDGVVVATHPAVSADVVGQCAELGIPRVWFHRSFGRGSVSSDAVEACRAHGIACIAGGCPLMYCEPVDVPHRCFRWWLRMRRRVPG